MTHAANWYDALDRLTASADLGTIFGSAATFPLAEGGFEAPSFGLHDYAYTPSGSAWTFTSTAGISDNDSPFTSGNPDAPEGTQVAVIQGVGTASQTVSGVTAGTYVVRFKAAQRGNYHVADQSFEVRVDGQVVGTFTPSSTSYDEFVTAAVRLGAGPHSIEFRGLDVSTVHTAFVDDVRVEEAAAVVRAVPDRSDTALVTTYAYDVLVDGAYGDETTDPRGTKTRVVPDLLGRTTAVTEAYTTATPTAADNRVTRYAYDGAGRVRRMTADLATDQVTEYVYGARAVASVTRSGSAATVTLAGHAYRVGDSVVVAGAADAAYNGTVTVVSVPSTGTFTYAVGGSPATPATPATGSAITVRRASAVASNDLLEAVRYPDKSTGAAGAAATDQESYTYNALGEATTYRDKNGTVHAYAYDVLGRTLSDTVTSLATGVNGAVRRLETAYDTQGNAAAFTSLGAAGTPTIANSATTATATLAGHGLVAGDTVVVTGANQPAYNGTFAVTAVTSTTFSYTMTSDPGASASGTLVVRKVVNQVKRSFNGLGQLTAEYQAHNGAVDTATTPKVQYAYTEMAGGANHSRLTRMTYPGGRVVRYQYGAAGGLDDRISRTQYLADDAGGSVGTRLEEYGYLGLGTVVNQKHPEPNLDLSYVKHGSEGNGEAGDPYAGLDRFGRVVDQRWLNPTTGTAADRFVYGYDRNSNVLYKDNKTSAANSELYHADGTNLDGYDKLNRLTGFQRGTLVDGDSDGVPDSTASADKGWVLDPLGNWTALTTTLSSTPSTTEARTHNAGNQVTSTAPPGSCDCSTYAYDADGNLKTATANSCGTSWNAATHQYDAWNRATFDSATACSASAPSEVAYQYDALGRRVVATGPTTDTGITDFGGGLGGRTVVARRTDLYYSARWQVVDDKAATTTTSYCYTGSPGSGWTQSSSASSTATIDDQYVWGDGYVDDLVLRDRSGTGVVTPDTTFDADGLLRTDFASGNDVARAVAVQADGKVVAAGTSVSGSDSNLAIARYNANGSLDTTFAGDGTAVTDVNNVEGYGAIDLEADGDILVGGYQAVSGNGRDFLLARYNPDGTLDAGFGSGGFVTTDFDGNGGHDQVRAVAELPDGSVVAVGDAVIGASLGVGGVRRLAVARYTAAGALDTAFGTGGKVTLAVGTGGADGYGLVVQPDGKLVIAGYASSASTGTDMVAVRLNANGTLDSDTFGAADAGDLIPDAVDGNGRTGVATIDFNGSDDRAYAVALAPDGSLVLAGDAAGSGGSTAYMAAARLTPDGTLDAATFGSGGKVTTFTAAASVANAVAVDGLGRATLAGSVVRSGSERDVAVARLNPDGSADATFGSSGRVQTNFATNRDDAAYAVALTAAGGAVVAGTSVTGGSGDFAVAQYRPGGTATQRLYALQDANFNVTALADAGGTVVQRFRYDPYGKPTVVTANWGGTTADGYGWSYLHQGGRMEAATGTYHFRNRDYDPTLGRWLQEDPAGYVDGANLLLAYNSRPNASVDALGLTGFATPAPSGSAVGMGRLAQILAGWRFAYDAAMKARNLGQAINAIRRTKALLDSINADSSETSKWAKREEAAATEALAPAVSSTTSAGPGKYTSTEVFPNSQDVCTARPGERLFITADPRWDNRYKCKVYQPNVRFFSVNWGYGPVSAFAPGATEWADKVAEAAARAAVAPAAVPSVHPSVNPLPANPDDLLKAGYKETSHPSAAAAGHRTFENPTTGDRVRFDKGKPGAPGFEGEDHYHRENPASKSKEDAYLDKNGKPTTRGSGPSHILPG